MIRTLSVPLIAAGFVSGFFFIFYLILNLRTRMMEKQNRSYLIFSILAFVNSVYVISFAVLLNSGDNLSVLNISNRLTILFSMFVILLTLHFNKFFFNLPGKRDLIIFYILNGLFSIINFIDHPLFLEKRFLKTSIYYTGLGYGVLFQIWGLYVICMMFYSIIVLLKGYVKFYRYNKRTSRPLLYIIFATVFWNSTGILDALTGIQIIDLPPLTWAGSLVMILSIEIMLVTKIETLYYQIQALYEEIIYDSSTRVYTKSYFEIEMDKNIEILQENNQIYFLILSDIDDFKRINDSYGHLCGDYVIKRIAGIMKHNIRKPDIIARYGGDEFIILITNTSDIDSTSKMIERLRIRIGEEKFRYNTFSFTVTCSFGITAFNKASISKDFTRDEIISRADAALYHSKRKGKNMVHILKM